MSLVKRVPMARSWVVLGMAGSLLFVSVPPAGANSKAVHDANDVKRDIVDIELATADHRGNKLTHTIDAYDPFTTKKAPCLLIRTSSIGHGYEVCGNGKLRPRFVDQKPGVGRVVVERPAPDQVLYVIPQRKVGNPERYWWQAFTGCGCDFAPNTRGIRHSL